MLGVNGESIFTVIKAAHLLFVAKTILLDLNDMFQSYPVCLKNFKFIIVHRDFCILFFFNFYVKAF